MNEWHDCEDEPHGAYLTPPFSTVVYRNNAKESQLRAKNVWSCTMINCRRGSPGLFGHHLLRGDTMSDDTRTDNPHGTRAHEMRPSGGTLGGTSEGQHPAATAEPMVASVHYTVEWDSNWSE
ncbi:hypothetical protein VT84_22770 [Gemmata sp. SH-PL17]|nr:hypothetical protein VT84_22770 [Gemmata sp. SH-PL17]